MIDECKHFETVENCLLRRLAGGIDELERVCPACSASLSALDLPENVIRELKSAPKIPVNRGD